ICTAVAMQIKALLCAVEIGAWLPGWSSGAPTGWGGLAFAWPFVAAQICAGLQALGVGDSGPRRGVVIGGGRCVRVNCAGCRIGVGERLSATARQRLPQRLADKAMHRAAVAKTYLVLGRMDVDIDRGRIHRQKQDISRLAVAMQDVGIRLSHRVRYGA